MTTVHAGREMGWPIIRKAASQFAEVPNLSDYARARATFTWEGARRDLDGLPSGGLNIAHEAVTRHAVGPRRSRVALRMLGRHGQVRDLTYGGLEDESNRFANVLVGLGIEPGERVSALAGRIPELYVSALGTLKARSVFCPLFSAFGPEPIRQRLAMGQARVLVTTDALYRKKVEQIRDALPDLEHVLLVGRDSKQTLAAGTRDMRALLAAADPRYEIGPTHPEDMALLHFTSGTTGMPKGAIHVHEAVVSHHATGTSALDLHDDDIFWCTADPGWVTGTSYGIISPLTHGVTSIVDEAEFDAERWYGVLQDQRVSVWYTAPTAIRVLMRAGADLARGFDLSRLRFIASVGEPPNPEAVVLGQEHYYLGTRIDLTRATSWLASANEPRPAGERILIAVLLVKAAARAVTDVPEMNGFWIDDGFRSSEPVHAGIAVSLRRGGLIAPCIHDADQLGIDDLSSALRDLVRRARAGQLRGVGDVRRDDHRVQHGGPGCGDGLRSHLPAAGRPPRLGPGRGAAVGGSREGGRAAHDPGDVVGRPPRQ